MEKNNETYVGRVMRLTLLAPDTVEAILNGRQPAELQMDVLMRRFSVEWRSSELGVCSQGAVLAKTSPQQHLTCEIAIMNDGAVALEIARRFDRADCRGRHPAVDLS
jgi:hypothetical protein